MKIDSCGTKCDRCEYKIRWWHACFPTYDGRYLHKDCFIEEGMADRSADLKAQNKSLEIVE